MSLESISSEPQDTAHNPNSSALICLQKISEFSQPDTREDNKTIINKAIEFISEITRADYIIVGGLTNDNKAMTIHGSYGVKLSNIMEGNRTSLIEQISKNRIVFNENDSFASDIVLALLPNSGIKSGVSIPIKVDTKVLGCLLVFSKSDVTYSASKIFFLEHVSHLISHYLQQKLLFPFEEQTARKVVEAKQEWERTIDALPQLVIVLDARGVIVRVNQAIKQWGIGTVTSMKGKAINEILTILSPGIDSETQWNEMWWALSLNPFVEWEFENSINAMSLRFSLRHLHTENQNDNYDVKQYPGYAVLIVDNITERVQTQKQQTMYTDSLESQLVEKVRQLEVLNKKLFKELGQHKRAKKALRVSESRYTHLVENTLVGICVLAEGKIEFWNQRFAEIIGDTQKNLQGTQLLRLIDREYRVDVYKQLTGILSGDTDKYLGVIKMYSGLKSRRWIKIKLNLISTEEPDKILVNIFDITTQTETEISLRDSEIHLHNLYSRLVSAQESERKRVASELHDGLGQILSSIKYQVENAVHQMEKSIGPIEEGIKSRMQSIVQDIRHAIEETRCMAMDLRPTILDDLGIIQTIDWFCRQFQQTFKEIKVRKEVSVEEELIDEKLKLVIYRIIQESFNNVVKHSNASEVHIKLYKSDNQLKLVVEDNGVGFAVEGSENKFNKGLGLNNMRERAEFTGGLFHIDVNQLLGTRVNVSWPLNREIPSGLYR